MAFKGLIFVVLLLVVTPGYGRVDGMIPVKHVRNVIEIGKAPGTGMAMTIPSPPPQPWFSGGGSQKCKLQFLGYPPWG